MSGAILATQLNGGGNIIIMGRNADGIMSSTTQGGFAIAADRDRARRRRRPAGSGRVGRRLCRARPEPGVPGIDLVAPSLTSRRRRDRDLPARQRQGRRWPGSEIATRPTSDLDGVDHVFDPFEFDADNGCRARRRTRRSRSNFSRRPIGRSPTASPAPASSGPRWTAYTPNQDAQTADEILSRRAAARRSLRRRRQHPARRQRADPADQEGDRRAPWWAPRTARATCCTPASAPNPTSSGSSPR